MTAATLAAKRLAELRDLLDNGALDDAAVAAAIYADHYHDAFGHHAATLDRVLDALEAGDRLRARAIAHGAAATAAVMAAK